MAEFMAGCEFMDRLEEAGMSLPKNVRRVVIDIPCDDPVIVYYETVADKVTMDIVIEQLIQHGSKIQIKGMDAKKEPDKN